MLLKHDGVPVRAGIESTVATRPLKHYTDLILKLLEHVHDLFLEPVA